MTHPAPIKFTTVEGGDWIAWGSRRAPAINCVEFEDGSQFDTINGWRPETLPKKRSVAQNRLQRMWCKEISEQLDTGETPEEIRGHCKLAFGVPILCMASEEFRKKYTEMIQPLPYETRLAMMQEPFDWPVTRKMSTKQLTDYLDHISRWYSEQGVRLTEPMP